MQAVRAASFGMNVGDAIGVGGGAVAHDFAVDRRVPRLGMFELFQDEHAGPFAQHEAVAVVIEGTRGVSWGLRWRREGREQVETGDAERMDHAVCAAGEHHVGIAAADDLRRLADRLAARRRRR